jgi:hypothetical protein
MQPDLLHVGIFETGSVCVWLCGAGAEVGCWVSDREMGASDGEVGACHVTVAQVRS